MTHLLFMTRHKLSFWSDGWSSNALQHFESSTKINPSVQLAVDQLVYGVGKNGDLVRDWEKIGEWSTIARPLMNERSKEEKLRRVFRLELASSGIESVSQMLQK